MTAESPIRADRDERNVAKAHRGRRKLSGRWIPLIGSVRDSRLEGRLPERKHASAARVLRR
jgi:hypothetical protein